MRKVWIAHEPAAGGLCTRMLQDLIDHCAAEGGGQVRLTAGLYVTGSIYLKTGVELYLDAGAVLRGSPDRHDYSHVCTLPTMVEGVPQWYNAILAAEDARDVSITGEGLIDGADCPDPDGEQGFRGPHAVFFHHCENVHVSGVTLVRAACYHLMFESCRRIRVRHVSIYGGQDGFRFGDCEDAEVRDCDVRSGDDCIGGSGNRDIRILDTSLNTPGGAVLQMSCHHLHVKHCVFWGPGLYPAVFREDKRYSLNYAAVCAGLDYGYARGEDSDDWLFEDVTFENAELLFRWEENMYDRVNIPLHHVVFDHCRALNLVFPCLIDAAEGSPIDLTFRDCEFTCAHEDARCEGLFLRGKNFRRLEMDRVVLRGYQDRPFDLTGAGTVELCGVRIEHPLTADCLPPESAQIIRITSEDTPTRLGREAAPGTTSLYLPVDADEAFRGALPWIPNPLQN